MAHIFISYSKQNIDFARHLRHLLQNEGFSVWMDETQLGASEKWWSSIESNIKTASAFIVILSPESRESDWVEREILVAEDKRHRIPIFPVLLSGEQWSRLANIQYEDMRAGVKATLTPGFVRRLEAVVPHEHTDSPPPLPGAVLPVSARQKWSFLASPKWQGIGALVSIVGVLVAILTIYLANNPTPNTPAVDLDATNTEIYRQRTLIAQQVMQATALAENTRIVETSTLTASPSETATEDLLQRTVDAQEVANAALLAENTQIAASATERARPTVTNSPPPTQMPTATPSCEGTIVVSTGTGTSLNQVRSTPQRNALPRPAVTQGSTVTITSKQASNGEEWYQISYGSNRGWIPAEYVDPASNCP